jgi:predicted nucleotide-binding protein (sugar kinase/HSP70/actin superfamily)
LGIKVGIPRSLFYYKYYPLWKTFLEELGAEIIVSDATNKRILDAGVKACVDEACLPVKLFHGHVLNLAGRVDYIFAPRFTSISRNEYVCPEFGGLPDMVRHSLKDIPTLIDTEVNLRKSGRNSWRAAYETGCYFTRDKLKIKRAFRLALKDYRDFRNRVRGGRLPFNETDYSGVNGAASSDKQLKIAVIGHAYNLYDKYINMNMLEKLRKSDAVVITVDMLEEADINRYAVTLNKPIFWNFGRKALGGILSLIDGKNVDGIIYVMSFGCGIDSFICDLAERWIRRQTDIPFIILTLDEHSGEAGLNTRLEAFIDMIGWRSSNGYNVSTPG